MRTLLDILQDPKPMRLTMTYDAPAPCAILVTMIAHECGISTDAAAQRFFNHIVSYLAAAGTGSAASFGSPMDTLLSAFPELDRNGPMLTMLFAQVPGLEEAMNSGAGGFDFRNFMGAKP